MLDDENFIASILRFRERISQSDYAENIKATKLHQLFSILITRISDETKVQFTSQFARLSYIITAYNLSYKEGYILHVFRKRGSEKANESIDVKLGETSIDILMATCLQQSMDLNSVSEMYKNLTKDRKSKKISFLKSHKAFLKHIDRSHKRIEAQSLVEPFDSIIIGFDRADRNEDYTNLFDQLVTNELLPLVVNLINIEIDDEQIYYPSSIVFEPDYLYDVTSISECFGAFANHQSGYLLRKFLPKAASKPILIGNISNFFLDQLVYRPDAKFEDFIGKIFVQNPLGIALLSDQEVRETMVLLENHFNHIKEVVVSKFPQINIQSNSCQVEPSFYSSKYGIQGRLDLFSFDETGATIIELKSGSAYRPNSYGLANNHYHQTLLYDMLIESVYGSKLRRNNFILYSKENTNQLRFAPALKVEQREAIKERNQLYVHDRILMSHDDFVEYYEKYARINSQNIKGFLRTDYTTFLKFFTNLDSIERRYCSLLFQFIYRELFINKLGNEGSERSNGLATLWMQDVDTKKDQFNILNHLEIIENNTHSEEPLLTFKLSERSALLSNFRPGDLGILYPFQNDTNDILRHQVFKVTLITYKEGQIKVRLRSRQENASIFENYKYWHIEHDSLENGFYEMSRSLYEFARSDKSYRDLILGRRAPEIYKFEAISCGHHLTDEQTQIFSEIIKAKEYYLLWGPPGTGKTSVMLREIAHHFIEHENDRILFLAYTNRAVDEICEALYSLDIPPEFIRIGSRYSTSKKFHEHLLEEQIKDISNRKKLRQKLKQVRVYVGTVASVVGKVSLFELVKFDMAVVDEASQILDTSLIGLLSRMPKFVLIGDHKQLPAVVQQNKDSCKVVDSNLISLGHRQLSSSLFERMYNTAVRNKWGHAIGQLTHQGRMHRDIMSFVNEHFYNNELTVIEGINRLSASSFYKNDLAQTMDRLLFYPSKIDIESDSIKINKIESAITVQICVEIIERCKKYGVKITDSTLGVITPYRAQIAAIRSKFAEHKVPELDLVTIDTVERYQGGARDIIVMSSCMNYSFQLDALVSLSEDGIDRKLNVAITRAKEQFILIGNQAILEQNKYYKVLIEQAKIMAMYI